MKRLGAVILWILINLLPDALAMWLMDLILPGWERAAKKAIEGSSRGAD